MNTRQAQTELCARFGATPDFVGGLGKLGASRSMLDPTWPINGVRHPAEGDTCGWFLWAGEFSTARDFFVPMHAEHVLEARPEVGAYLGLPPGWGFVIAPGFEDVWYDEGLLSPS